MKKASAVALSIPTDAKEAFSPSAMPQPLVATFDPERARRQLGLDEPGFARIFDCIWLEVSERRSQLERALEAGDLTRVLLHAHTIKSSAATIGAGALSQTAAAMEKAAEAGRIEDLVTAYQAFRVAKETLSKLLGMG